MNKIKSHPSNTILVINTGLILLYFFLKLDFILSVILILSLIGVFSNYLSLKIEYLWFNLAYMLSLVIPNIILTFIFYFFLFPIALLSKIKLKDPLNLRNHSNTMFKEVNKSFNKESFKNTW
jgi:hypothetical protein